MIYVKEHIHKNGYTIEVSGHAEYDRDVCVSVTANMNTLHQFIVDQQELHNVKLKKREYQLGNSYIDFEILHNQAKDIIKSVVDAIMRGIKLIQYNFPQEVSFWWGYD